jgi:hypothetical protein
MMSRILWIRILVGGFLSELALIVVFIPTTILLGQTAGVYVAVAGSLLMPFLFGFWAAQKAHAHNVLHGLLVGAIGILIYVGLTRGAPEPLLYLIAHGLKLIGGAAGGYTAGSIRARREILPNLE